MAQSHDIAEPKRLIAERRYGEAIVTCRKMLVTDKDRPDINLLLGQALLAEERFDDARVEMLALVRAHPELGSAHRLLGEAHLRTGHKERADEALRRALELEPDDETARELLDELSEERFPVAQTIERWFGEDETRTVETELPAFEEEHTPVPGRVLAQPAREISIPATSAPPIVFEPSIQIDPGLTAEVARLQREQAVGPPSDQLFETSDTTLPGAPPTRGEGLRLLLERAGPLGKKPIAKPPSSLVSSSTPGPSGTQVARPLAKGAPQSVASPPASIVSPASPASPRSPVSPAPSLVTATAASPAPADAEPKTAELALPELEEEFSTELPAPIADDSDELELTRPLPPLSMAELKGAPIGLMSRPSHLPPVKAPPPRVDLDPRVLPAFGPSLGSLGPVTAAPSPTAIVPLPPLAGVAASPAPSFTPSAHAQGLPVPPTAMHAPAMGAQPFANAPPPDARRGLDRRRKLAVGAAVGVGVLLLLAIVWATSGPSALDLAIATASDDGRPASFEAALALAPADGSDLERASRAMLLSIASLELGVDHLDESDRLLSTLEGESGALPEARIARASISVARGQGGQALTVLVGLNANGPVLVEAFRARALALAQVGDLTEAVDSARQAATLAPTASRHAALYAELSVLNHDANGAQRVLDGIVGIDDVATLRLARAELGMLGGADDSTIRSDVDALLGSLVTSSTGPELGRAHLLRAQLAIRARDLESGRSDLELASTLIPGFDSRRRIQLAEAMLEAGAPARALEVARALTGETADPAARAEVVVRAALAAGDVTAAEGAVSALGESPRTNLLRARIAEARGRLDEARSLYALAAADRTLVVVARTAEGRLYLLGGHSSEAVVALTEALGANPASAPAVLLFTRAALVTNDVAAAERVVGGAIAIAPEEPEILAASALVARARGRFDQAYDALERALRIRPTDAELMVEQGEAAMLLSRLDDAQRLFDAAAALRAPPPAVHVNLARLALERGRLEMASASLGRATGAPELDVSRVRARILVARGAGRSGTTELGALRHGRGADVVLSTALASLLVQAEDDRAARGVIAGALRRDADDPDALILSALIDTHEGRSAGARTSLDRAERSAAARGALPSVRARILAVRARVAFDGADATEARARAEEAVRLDPLCAEAHLLLADLEIEASRDPIPELRLALAGTAPPGEAVGRLALRLGTGEERCALARRYLEIAPRGYDARDVQSALDDCP
jgi:tetratricopeptide (TPR) repeat protein